MIQSMTGYGAAQHAEQGVGYVLEVRSVNNRYLKLAIKLPEHLQFAEPAVERLLRARIARGSVTYTLRLHRQPGSSVSRINPAALQEYVEQLSRVRMPEGVQAHIDLALVAQLPGVCDVSELDEDERARQLGVIESLTERALGAMIDMRREEGRALQVDLHGCIQAIRDRLGAVASRAPNVIQDYHERLRARVATLTQSAELSLEETSLAREVAIYAERCDIGEELTRLASHLDQFIELCGRGDQVGRTLDFLAQELLREANTIGSKSNDAAISRHIVEIKGHIDRLKEQVQNVE